MSAEALDPVFKALADPTRRAILDLLREAPRTTGDLAERFVMSRFGVMKHLEILVEAGLVVARKSGRERWNHLNAVPLQQIAERWMGPYEAFWSAGLLRLARHLESPHIASSHQGESHMPQAPAILDTLNSYVVAQEIVLNATPDKVFTGLTADIGYWWGAPHAYSPEPSDIVLEPFAGGRFMEVMPDGGSALFCQVTRYQPSTVLELRGHMAMSAPCNGVIRFELEPEGEGTRLKLTHAFTGPIGEEMRDGYGMGWNLLLDTKLRAWVERGEKMGARQ